MINPFKKKPNREMEQVAEFIDNKVEGKTSNNFYSDPDYKDVYDTIGKLVDNEALLSDSMQGILKIANRTSNLDVSIQHISNKLETVANDRKYDSCE